MMGFRVWYKLLLATGVSILIGAVFTGYLLWNSDPALAQEDKAAVSAVAAEIRRNLPAALEDAANPLTRRRWSPYAAGIGIGILSWLAFLLSNHPLGVSTAFARTSGMIQKPIQGEKVEEKAYYQKFPPRIDWEWMLVAGLIVGALLSALLSGDFRWEGVPPMWEGMFGGSAVLRIIVAFIGGVVLIIGARWAGGCTSGHGISGTLQMAASGWLAIASFFSSGIIAALIIYTLA